jgi:hypothetical protein
MATGSVIHMDGIEAVGTNEISCQRKGVGCGDAGRLGKSHGRDVTDDRKVFKTKKNSERAPIVTQPCNRAYAFFLPWSNNCMIHDGKC